jgi:hypothetical protein
MNDTDFSPLETRTEQDINNFSALLRNPEVLKGFEYLLLAGVIPSARHNKLLNYLTQIPRWLARITALPYRQYQFGTVLEQWLLAYQKYPLVLDYRLEQTCTNPSASSFPVMNRLLYCFLMALHRLLLSTQHRKRLYFNQREASENYKSCCAYVDGLFACCTRLVVIRLDFDYNQTFASSVTFEQAQAHLKQLLNNTRHNNKLFNELKGYIAKVEYGLDKQIHIHTLFFFNGHKRKGSSDVYLAEGIGEYWKNNVTQGTGEYWNCNENKSRYRYVGIGLIDISDTTKRKQKNLFKRKNLLRVVQYFCKKDTQMIKPRHSPQAKTLFRGDLRKHNPKLGRPRSLGKQVYELGVTGEGLNISDAINV